MLHAFSALSKPTDSPPPSVDFGGVWRNELGSQMTLTVSAEGAVAGKYKTAVGVPPVGEEFDLVGFAGGDLISFTVNFGKYGSLTSWVGQHTIDKGSEVLKTMWLLAKNVPDDQEPAKLWGCVLTGYNNFTR